jgi:hypothetical protein
MQKEDCWSARVLQLRPEPLRWTGKRFHNNKRDRRETVIIPPLELLLRRVASHPFVNQVCLEHGEFISLAYNNVPACCLATVKGEEVCHSG